MGDHWSQVEQLLSELMAKISLCDKNGIDLKFSNSRTASTPWSHRGELIKDLRRRKPLALRRKQDSSSKLGAATSWILRQYLAGRQTRNCEVVIFTDTSWQNNSPVAKIINEFSKLRRLQGVMGTIKFQYVNFKPCHGGPRILSNATGK